MEITQKTKLFDVLKAYPQLEERIINTAPPFKNLKNPILRRTVGKLASIEKVAEIGKIDVVEFINMLREIVGQEKLIVVGKNSVQTTAETPTWATGKPTQVIDGVEMLERGEQPVNWLVKRMNNIEDGQFIVLKTNFAPLPLIETLKEKGYTTYHSETNGEHLSFFKK
jgi:hypothetical protein